MASDKNHPPATPPAPAEGGKGADGPVYVIADGKALSFARGIVEEGQEITAADFGAHKDEEPAVTKQRVEQEIQALVQAGYLKPKASK